MHKSPVPFLLSALFTLVSPPLFAGDYDSPANIELKNLASTDAGYVSDVSKSSSTAPADNAFDHDMATRWLAYRRQSDCPTAYFVYSFTTSTVVNAYRIWAGGTYGNGREPNSWKFFGSNDNLTWIELDSRSLPQSENWGDDVSRYFCFFNNTAYSYYKFACTKQENDANYLQIQEFELFNLYGDISTRYVDASIADGGKHSGTDWDDAYSSIVDAVESVNQAKIPATIYVKPGFYETSAQLELHDAIRIVGWTSNPVDVVITNRTAYSSLESSFDNRVAKINDFSAAIYNVTLSGAGCSSFGGCVYIGEHGGTVSNCVLGATVSDHYSRVGAVYLGGPNALLSHCVVKDVQKTNNDVFWDLVDGKPYEYGLGVHVVKGRVENCLVRNVKATSLSGSMQGDNYDYSATNSVGGVYLAGPGAVMRNCTIADCQATKAGGVNAQSGSQVENCVIVDSRHFKLFNREKDEAIDPWCGDASAFVNCATDSATPINGTCIVGSKTAFFKDCASDALVPKFGGLLHDAGREIEGWTKLSGRVDLLGKRRVVGEKVDIGAYEQQLTGLFVIFE